MTVCTQKTQPSTERQCPVCGGSERRTLFSQSFDHLSGAQLLDGYEIVICEDCGAAFADRIPPQSAFDAYYRDLSKYENTVYGGRVSSHDDQRFRRTAETILPHIPTPQSRVLEIGCATGHLLSLLRQSGINEVHGVDPSPGCAKAAAEQYGITVDSYSIFDIPEPAEPFDFLILVGVMEHIRDLDLAIGKIKSLLAPAGSVYLAVPDAVVFARQTDGPFQEFSVEHLNFFSLSSLTNLMQMRGFRRTAGGRFLCNPSHGTEGWVAWGVFQAGPFEPLLEKDLETEPGLVAYIQKSEQVEARVRERIAHLAASCSPILVWGTGAHTLRLLAEGGLDAVNIQAFIDSNPKYQGRQLHGLPVLGPAELHQRREPILISSFASQHDITVQIRDMLQLTNEIITLYEIQGPKS